MYNLFNISLMKLKLTINAKQMHLPCNKYAQQPDMTGSRYKHDNADK
jgi:hypothetical protein